jgi:hypothetical protein
MRNWTAVLTGHIGCGWWRCEWAIMSNRWARHTSVFAMGANSSGCRPMEIWGKWRVIVWSAAWGSWVGWEGCWVSIATLVITHVAIDNNLGNDGSFDWGLSEYLGHLIWKVTIVELKDAETSDLLFVGLFPKFTKISFPLCQGQEISSHFFNRIVPMDFL